MNDKTQKIRYHLLDELRGFAVFCMVVYHALFTLNFLFSFDKTLFLYNFFTPVEPVFAAFFIFLSGLCSTLSSSNIKRGAKLLLLAAAITLVTVFFEKLSIDLPILFGILHCLSICMLLVGFSEKILKKIPQAIGLSVCSLLFLLCYNIPMGYLGFGRLRLYLPQSLFSSNLFFFLGFHNHEFYSSDYFPLLPWVFIFFAGFFAGKYFEQHRFPSFFENTTVPFFAFCGRNSLKIYILHQPIIFTLAYIIKLLF